MGIKPRTIAVFLILLGAVYLLVKTLSVYWIIVFFSLVLIYINSVFLFAYFELSQKPRPQIRKWPTVSVLIPNYNGERTLVKCLESIAALE